jgi:hypothetical protein
VSGIYGNPRVYELAFGSRDFAAEAAFLRQLAEKHGGGVLCDCIAMYEESIRC